MKALYLIFVCSFLFSSCSRSFDSIDEKNNFPFNKSELLISLDKVEPDSPSNNYFTGFTKFEQKIFYRTNFSSDVSQYDLKSNLRQELGLDYPGSYLAHDSIYIFYEMGISIWRYNTQLKKMDLKFDLRSLDNALINGLTSYNDLVYAYFHSYPSNNESNLVSFDKNGKIQEIIPIDRPIVKIAIYDEILYSLLYDSKDDILVRFNIKTKKFLPDINIEDNILGSFCFDNDIFYYADFKKKQIRYFDASLLP